jgi:hypothetical protein
VNRKQGAKQIEWTDNQSREAANGFYMAKGAQIRETDVFRLEL